jgi:hypothetical protein
MDKRKYLILGFVMLGIALAAAFPRFEHVPSFVSQTGIRLTTPVMRIHVYPKTAGDGLIVLGLCIVSSMAFYLAQKR